jgi:hypothetical protein
MKFISALCFFFFFLCGSIHAGDIKLDFLAGTLNGKKLNDLTIDSVTDMLGRPTKAETIPATVATSDGNRRLVYSEQGLEFFAQSGTERITAIHVFLTPKTEDFSPIGLGIANYSAFSGELPRNLSGNWKFGKFLEAFKQEGAVDTSQPEKTVVHPVNQAAICRVFWVDGLGSNDASNWCGVC